MPNKSQKPCFYGYPHLINERYWEKHERRGERYTRKIEKDTYFFVLLGIFGEHETYVHSGKEKIRTKLNICGQL